MVELLFILGMLVMASAGPIVTVFAVIYATRKIESESAVSPVAPNTAFDDSFAPYGADTQSV